MEREVHETLTMRYYLCAPMLVRARQEGLDGGHAPAGIALMAGEASGLLDVWASNPSGFYACCGASSTGWRR
jgi:hypothetical protein